MVSAASLPTSRKAREVGHPLFVIFNAQKTNVVVIARRRRGATRPVRKSQFGTVFEKILCSNLAIGQAVLKTPFRARSVRGTRHSVPVADAGSNPAGSILPVVAEKLRLRREGRDISSSISSSN